jgi:hypothetical protein
VSEVSGAEVSAYLLILGGLVWVLVGIIGLSRPRRDSGEIGLKGKE